MQLPLEVREYSENNKPIPFDLFLKYKDEYDTGKKVLVKCTRCKKDVEMIWSKLKNNNYEKEICWRCKSMETKQNKLNIPIEMRGKNSKENPVSYETYLKYKDSYPKGCRKWIEIKCTECNETKLVMWRKIVNRTYCKDMEICNDCINKFTSRLPEVRKINSEAQKIAQNRPETVYKRNKAVRAACNTDEMKKKRKINAKMLWKNKEYRSKAWHTLSTLKGHYNNIKFDSSYELSALIYFKDKIQRSEDIVPYFYNGEWHSYFPDFILKEGNKNILLEIKGAHSELVDVKKEYALEYIKNNDYDEYRILYGEDLLKLPNFKLITRSNIDSIQNLKVKQYPKSWIK